MFSLLFALRMAIHAIFSGEIFSYRKQTSSPSGIFTNTLPFPRNMYDKQLVTYLLVVDLL